MLRIWMAIALSTLPSQAMSNEHPELQAVPYVELNRYLGRWYEIARFPHRFQKDCDQATAEYSLRDDRRIKVINICRKLDGADLKRVEGIAEIVDPTSNAKLEVSFLPSWLRWTAIGKGDYWIIDLADDYSFAVVSEPKRKYLWILSRDPAMPRKTYEAILRRLKDKNFDLTTLIPSRDNAIQ